MKIRLGTIASFAIAVMSLPLFWHAAPGQTVPKSPEQVVRDFYGWYFGAGFPDPKGKNLPTFRKYVTQRLLKEATAPDVDVMVFIDAQDYDKTWKVDSVSKAAIQGQQANTLVILKGRESAYKMCLTLRQGNGIWKIDDVKNVTPEGQWRPKNQCIN